jgi:hypothetical protein
VDEALGDDSVKVPGVQHHDVIEALAPNGADQAFSVWILPGRSISGEHLGDAEPVNPSAEAGTIDSIAITKPIAGCRFPGERLHDLASHPLCRGMACGVEVEHSPSVARQDKEAEQDLELGSRHGEEVDRHELTHVIVKERTPGQGGLSS